MKIFRLLINVQFWVILEALHTFVLHSISIMNITRQILIRCRFLIIRTPLINAQLKHASRYGFWMCRDIWGGKTFSFENNFVFDIFHVIFMCTSTQTYIERCWYVDGFKEWIIPFMYRAHMWHSMAHCVLDNTHTHFSKANENPHFLFRQLLLNSSVSMSKWQSMTSWCTSFLFFTSSYCFLPVALFLFQKFSIAWVFRVNLTCAQAAERKIEWNKKNSQFPIK